MAFHQRHRGWGRMRNMFQNKKIVLFTSSAQIEPLLNDYLQLTDSPFNGDYRNSLAEINKRNFDLENKIDDLVKKATDIKSRYIKIERNHTDDFEDLNKKNSDLQRNLDEITRKVDDFQSNNTENENKKKTQMETIENRNAALEGEIDKLKAKIAALEVKLNDTDAKDAILKSLVQIGCTNMNEMKGSISPDGIPTGIIVLIFLICFLIGIQIRSFQ